MPQEIIDFLTKLFLEKGLILLIACFIVGQVVKSISVINNKYIPFIITAAGGIIAVVANMAGSSLLPESDLFIAACEGIMLGWAATGGYELLSKTEWVQNLIKKFTIKTTQ